MGRKPKISHELKIEAVERYLSGTDSYTDLAKELSVADTSVSQWVETYKNFGAEALLSKSKNTSFSSELKFAAVQDCINGKGSLRDIRLKYGLRSHEQLRSWIMKYNGHEVIRSSHSGEVLMTKGRKTTFDERIEIVKYCIEHNRDYNETAQHFKVSYQQVYSWTQKYESGGVEALQDRRGKNKPEDQMSELEKLRAQNKLLEAENRRKQMEIDFLKKLEEIERRRS